MLTEKSYTVWLIASAVSVPGSSRIIISFGLIEVENRTDIF